MESLTATGRSVRTRVELAAGQVTRLHLRDGGAPLDLDAPTLAALLAEGLEAPVAAHDEAPHAGTVELGVLEVGDGTVFTVGQTSLPTEMALEAVARGIVSVLRLGLRTMPRAQEGQAPQRAERPPLAGCDRVPLADAEQDLEVLVDRVSAGGRVVLTRDGEDLVVLLGWAEYCHLRERLARHEAAYWAAEAGERRDHAPRQPEGQ